MAQTKYWHLQLKGELSPDQVHAALPEGAVHLLRIHREKGETHAYFSAEQPGAPKGGSTAALEVPMDTVLKIG